MPEGNYKGNAKLKLPLMFRNVLNISGLHLGHGGFLGFLTGDHDYYYVCLLAFRDNTIVIQY